MRWMNRLPIRIWDCFVTTSCSFKMDRKHGKDTEFKWKTKPNSIQFQVVRYFFVVLLSSAFFFIPFECAIFYVLMDFFFSVFETCYERVCVSLLAFFFRTTLKSSSFHFIPLNCISYLLPVEFFIRSDILLYEIFMHSFDAVKNARTTTSIHQVQISAGLKCVLEILLLLWYMQGSVVNVLGFFSSFRSSLFCTESNVYDNQWT